MKLSIFILLVGVSFALANKTVPAMSSQDRERPVPGGVGKNEVPANEEIQSYVDKLEDEIKTEISKKLGGKELVGQSENGKLFEAISYKGQVVAGKNYFIKIRNHGDNKSIWHIRVYQHFKGDLSLSAVKGPEEEAKQVEYFER